MKFSMLAIAATALAAGVEGFSTVSAPRAMRQVSEEQLLSRELKKIHTEWYISVPFTPFHCVQVDGHDGASPTTA